jgi:RNA polymerase sigma-70 factor (ECF subfamily)
LNERQIISGCKKGDAKAQKAFVDSYSHHLFNICMRYMVDHASAKDALQESLMRILTQINKYDGVGNFKSWITTVTMRKNLELLRKNKSRWTASLADISEPETQATVHHQLEHEEVITFMSKLPDKYRVALQMFLVEGYSHKEIAEHLEMTEGGSRSLVSRGRKMIQDAFIQAEQRPVNTIDSIKNKLKIALL